MVTAKRHSDIGHLTDLITQTMSLCHCDKQA